MELYVNFIGMNYENVRNTFRTTAETYFPYEFFEILHRPCVTGFDGPFAADANLIPEKRKCVSCSYCQELVTRHVVWIGNWIYLTLITRNHKGFTHSTSHTANIKASMSSLGVARLRLLTVEVLQIPCSSPRWMAAGLQLALNGNITSGQTVWKTLHPTAPLLLRDV
jgi:hypothetical protein